MGWRLSAVAAAILSASFLELGLGLGLASGQTTPTAQEVATSIQRKYDTIRDFSADFVHTHEGGVLKRKRVERGTLLVKKPGKMRWTYQAPDEKVFVSDGVRLIQYFPDENRALVSEVPDDDQAAVLFLAGRGNLTRDFNVSFGQGTATQVQHGRSGSNLANRSPSTTGWRSRPPAIRSCFSR